MKKNYFRLQKNMQNLKYKHQVRLWFRQNVIDLLRQQEIQLNQQRENNLSIHDELQIKIK